MRDPKKDDERADNVRRVGRGMFGHAAGTILGDLGAGAASTISNRNKKPAFSENAMGKPLLPFLSTRSRDVEQLDKQKLLGELVRTGTRPSMFVGRHDVTRSFLDGGSPEIEASSPTTSTMFHEIGHVAKESNLSLKLRKHMEPRMHTLLTKSPEVPSIGDGLRLGFLMGAMAHPSDEHPVGKFVHDHAAMLTGLTELPTVMSELRASYSALKGMHVVGGARGVGAGLKTLAPALASYLAVAGGRVGGVALARRLSEPRKKEAAAMPTLGAPKMPSPPKVTGQLRLSTIAANKTPVGQLKPKTTPPHPGNRSGNFPGISTAKPPSLTGYYKDSMNSMDAPTRGTRA